MAATQDGQLHIRPFPQCDAISSAGTPPDVVGPSPVLAGLSPHGPLRFFSDNPPAVIAPVCKRAFPEAAGTVCGADAVLMPSPQIKRHASCSLVCCSSPTDSEGESGGADRAARDNASPAQPVGCSGALAGQLTSKRMSRDGPVERMDISHRRV
jgi:hypothetical protein